MKKNKTPLQILESARRLIIKGWCRGAFSVTKNGRPVYPWNKKAARWCVAGALSRLDPTSTYEEPKAAEKYLIEAAGTKLLTEWNDKKGRTKKEVIQLYDRAIELCQEDNKKPK